MLKTNIFCFEGAITGFVSSLAFAFWMSFGQPRPTAKKLLVSVENCSSYTSVSYNMNSSNNRIPMLEFTTPPTIQDTNLSENNYFYLYRISYAWYAFMGFASTFIIGIIASLLFGWFYYSKNNIENIDPDLFIETIRRKMSAKQTLQTQHTTPKTKDICIDKYEVNSSRKFSTKSFTQDINDCRKV
jgi:sodium-coupled monocarboxylate transporter 8/12